MMRFNFTEANWRSVRMAAEIIEQSLKYHYRIAELAEKAMLPEKKLKAGFRQLYGKGLYAYLRDLRLQKAKELLMEGMPVIMVMRATGYRSESHFTKAFKKCYGSTPAVFRRDHLKPTG